MNRSKQINIFSETALTILVSVVTLLLQMISFATTWSGSQIYLEGVFPYASLLFAVAIQATAYFFSNSLREKVTVLKVTAMLVALCCSTYYSYIGIYNSVNSPARFLQERYVQIEEELTRIYNAGLEERIGLAVEAVNDAASTVTARYTQLSEERENNCVLLFWCGGFNGYLVRIVCGIFAQEEADLEEKESPVQQSGGLYSANICFFTFCAPSGTGTCGVPGVFCAQS